MGDELVFKMPNRDESLEDFSDEAWVRKPNRRNGQKSTQCSRGHPLIDGHPNVYVNPKDPKKRVCRTCAKMHNRRFRERNPATVRSYGKKTHLTPMNAFERARQLAAKAKERAKKDGSNV